MSNKYLALRLERFVRDDRTEGIACAVTMLSDEKGSPKPWHSSNPLYPMDQIELQALLSYLEHYSQNLGYKILTVGGTAYDWKVLALYSGRYYKCLGLALRSVDTALQFHYSTAYEVEMGGLARAAGFKAQTVGDIDLRAPRMWAEGSYAQVLTFLRHATADALDIAAALEERSEKASIEFLEMKQWLTVEEAMKLPETKSWLSIMHPRKGPISWLGENAPAGVM